MGRLQIFLTNLGKYNEGVLMGEWVKLPVGEDELEAVMKRIGIRHGYEEYFITDYESSIANLEISEYISVGEVNELARQMEGWLIGTMKSCVRSSKRKTPHRSRQSWRS